MNPKALLLGLSSLLCSELSFAHEPDSGNPSHAVHRVQGDPDELRSRRYGAFEFRVAPYLLKIDREFDGATPYQDAFGKGPAWVFGIEGDWQLLRIPHFGSLGPALGWHYGARKGTAAFTDPTTEGTSAHPQRLWFMPMYAAAVFRLDVLKKDFNVPLVPYFKLGFAATMWEARDAHSVSTYNGEKARGLELGWNGHLGVMVHLNPLSAQSAADMDSSVGVNDAYLFIEWWYSNANSFGEGMQLGTSTGCAGIMVEF